MTISKHSDWAEVERRAKRFEESECFKFVPTFEHVRKQWCVQLIERGPCPIVQWCGSEQEAASKASEFNDHCSLFSEPCNRAWISLKISNLELQ